MQQIVTSLPDILYQQVLAFSASHQITESQAIVQILSNYFDALSKKEQLNRPINHEDWENLPDDEPDEILWDFLETKNSHTQNEDKDFFDDPDEVLSDFLD